MTTQTASRRRLIRKLLTEGRVECQQQIVEMLSDRGHHVAQATVSRDLSAIGAIKVRNGDGETHYEVDDAERFGGGDVEHRLARSIGDFVESITHSADLVVIHTAPGAAHLVASGIDGAAVDGVLGTVAGDDTILVVVDAAVGSADVQRMIERIGAR